jgi:hypothetical protein
MLASNIYKTPSDGNSPCGTNAALSSDRFQILTAGLSVLASRYAGRPVHGDIVRMAAQVERLASRAGAR